MATLRTACVLAALALVACSPTPPIAPSGEPASIPPAASTPTPIATRAASTTADRDAGWRSDLAMLIPAMDRIHPELTHDVSRAALDAAVDDLVATIPDAADDELMDGVLGIVAMVSKKGCDAHTGAFVWGTGTYPVESLALRLVLLPAQH